MQGKGAIRPLIRGIKGKKVAIIDDMIETGKTVYSVARYVEERGAKLCLVSAIEIKKRQKRP